MRLNSCDQISLPLSIFKYDTVSLEQTEGKRCLDIMFNKWAQIFRNALQLFIVY